MILCLQFICFFNHMFILKQRKDKMEKKKKKLKCYSVTFDSDVYAVSLVDEPAIESNFIALSKQSEKRVFLEKDDKHIVLGAVLIPDMPIYRNQDGEEFYLQFSSATIEKLAHDFLRMGRNFNFSYQHEEDVKGISVIESWIVNDPEKDKCSIYGIDVPSGTWMMAAKVDNEEMWEKIKNGDAKGFSIEAIVNLDELKLKKENTKEMAEEKIMDKKVEMEAVEITDGFWDKLRQIISDALGKPQEDPKVEDTVGKITDEIEKGAGPKDEETQVVEQAEENPMEQPVENPMTDEIAKEVVEDVAENSNTAEEYQKNLQEVVDNLNAEIEAVKRENAELKAKVEKLSKQPSTKPIKTEMSEHKQSPREIIEALRNGTYFK